MKIIFKTDLGFLLNWMFILFFPVMFIHNMNVYYFFPLNLGDMNLNFDEPMMFCFYRMK